MTVQWGPLVVDQLDFYWRIHFWPRLRGLTDDEYLWQPVDNCWTVRPDADGKYVMDDGKADPPPVTTIAWRMMHLATGVLGYRARAFFSEGETGKGEGETDRGDTSDSVDMFDPRNMPGSLPDNASDALDLLADSYRRWHDGIAALDEAGLAKPLGPKGGRFFDDPMAALVLHLNREVMHHGGEIGVLRDLYRARFRSAG